MSKKIKTPFAPISWGELIDKLTILEIKELKISSKIALENVRKELNYLLGILNSEPIPEEIQHLKTELMKINLDLWNVEDQIRDKEFQGVFDQSFIDLARSVYRLNDLRAATKKSINLILQSELVEEKSYKNFEK